MYEGRMDSFERNRYFYGKLLTAQDFIAEQEYSVDKRRLINRILFGPGIVCGMDIVKIDERTVSIESGLALDASGREIIIGQPLIKKLSGIEGFDTISTTPEEDDAIKSVYLCVAYKEEKSEPVYSIARSSEDVENSGPEYNKIAESYELFLTPADPVLSPSPACAAALCEAVVYDDGIVRITQVIPGFVRAGEEFFLETHISKGTCRRPVRFSCRLELSFLTSDGQHFTDIRFEEPEPPEECDTFIVKTKLRAYSQQPHEAFARVSDTEITIGTERKSVKDHRMKTHITSDWQNALLQSLRTTPLQKFREECPILYLARLQLIISPSYYSIEHIETLPFSQSVLTAPQIQSLYRSTKLRAPAENKSEPISVPVSIPEPEEPAQSGTVIVNIPSGAKKDSVYLSNPAPHGLGPGTAFITAGLNSGEHILFGSGIFENPFNWGVKLSKTDGTFQIGVRLMEDMPADSLSFCWRASRQTETAVSIEERLTLTPAVYYAVRKETFRFETHFSSGYSWRKGELRFTVRPESGADISDTGEFTSLDQPGIFEITVQSVINPKLSATAFVVVK